VFDAIVGSCRRGACSLALQAQGESCSCLLMPLAAGMVCCMYVVHRWAGLVHHGSSVSRHASRLTSCSLPCLTMAGDAARVCASWVLFCHRWPDCGTHVVCILIQSASKRHGNGPIQLLLLADSPGSVVVWAWPLVQLLWHHHCCNRCCCLSTGVLTGCGVVTHAHGLLAWVVLVPVWKAGSGTIC